MRKYLSVIIILFVFLGSAIIGYAQTFDIDLKEYGMEWVRLNFTPGTLPYNISGIQECEDCDYRFVNEIGDTMTGNLIVNANVTFDYAFGNASFLNINFTHSLDDAYDAGSVITVDNTMLVWNISNNKGFYVDTDPSRGGFYVRDSAQQIIFQIDPGLVFVNGDPAVASVHWVPRDDNTYDFGSSTKRWRDGYFAGNLYGNVTPGEGIFMDSTSGNVYFSNFNFNVTNNGSVVTSKNITANYFIGNGSQLTGIIGDNISWTQSLADTLYAVLGYGDDWNKTYADTLYADISVITDNASWNQSLATSLYADISVTGDNATWNQTLADTLYINTDGDDTMAGSLNLAGNITINSTNKVCLEITCSKYIYYNGSSVVIQG